MFYKELKQKIEGLLMKHQYHQAIILIEEELRAPYIPKDFENFLNENYQKARAGLEDKSKIKTTTPDIKNLKKMLETNQNSQHLLAIATFDKVNMRLLDKEIQTFLLRQDVNNDIKSLVLIALNQQEVGHIFQVWHNHEVLNLDPRKLDTSKLSDFNQKVIDSLEAIFFEKNRTLTDLAIKIAFLFLLNFFPKEFYFSVEDVVAMSIKRAGKMLNEEISWNQIKKLFSFDLEVAKALFAYQINGLD